MTPMMVEAVMVRAVADDGRGDESPEDIVGDADAINNGHHPHVGHVKVVQDSDADAGREDVVHDDVPCLRPVREPGDSHQEAHPGEGPGHDPELLLPEEGVGDLLVKEVRGVGVGDGLEHPTERQGAPDGKHEDDEPDEVGSEEEDDHQDGGHGQEQGANCGEEKPCDRAAVDGEVPEYLGQSHLEM